ncbi:MAG: hypothetical protein US70_C0005G0036 [Parcubacteria group bacterium GW2011_GWD2_38_11]|nr:MAG: hypothetical protein US70_C0005G0036 [Parcubacteria group bacterium GW2011_GWD2_38_11]
MSKRMIYGGPCVVCLEEKTSLEYVPKSEKLGVSVVQSKNDRKVIIKECRVYCRKKGIQFSLSDSVTFGWGFADIKSVQKSDGEIIWEAPSSSK